MKNILFNTVILMLFICIQTSWGADRPGVRQTATGTRVINEDGTPWHRDPFIGKTKKLPAAISNKLSGYKTIAPAAHEEEILLQGIMQAGKTYHALINGRVVKTGSRIGAITIRQISRYQVVVQNATNKNVVYDIYQGRIDKDRGKK